jgi:asparagine N-glycosylation enzyme membrane subunit Stt3
MSFPRHKSIILILVTVVAIGMAFGFSAVRAQKPKSPVVSRPFEPAEELHFDAEFSRALLRKLDVAELRFRASRTPLIETMKNSNEPYALTFSADIASKGFFTRLFNLKFRERVESTVEPVSFTVQKTTILDEQGKRVRKTEATFDRSKGTMTWTLRDPNNPSSETHHKTTEFSGQLQDILSAIYFIRTQPLEVGRSFEIFIGDGGRVYQVPVKVVEKKRMKTILGRVSVLRVDPELFGPDKLIDDEKGQFSLWFTDDARHIPVGGRIKTDYGTFELKLKRLVT